MPTSEDRPTRWEHLQPDERLLRCLDVADQEGSRAEVLQLTEPSPKGQWSSRFADACAKMVAEELSRHPVIRRNKLTVLPDERAEPPTFVAGGKTKKVDVVASSAIAGLQVGFSLKGGNFRDRANRNFDKNITGRAYELKHEMELIHGYQPSAFMVCLYYLPIGSTCDKPSASSFAHLVQFLRANTGRTDHMSPGQMTRFDMSVIGLYVPGDVEHYEYATKPTKSKPVPEPKWFSYKDPFPRGVVRYFDVEEDPPRFGRPQLGSTLDLSQVIQLALARYTGEGVAIDWAEAESEHEGEAPPPAADRSVIVEYDDDTNSS